MIKCDICGDEILSEYIYYMYPITTKYGYNVTIGHFSTYRQNAKYHFIPICSACRLKIIKNIGFAGIFVPHYIKSAQVKQYSILYIRKKIL